MDEPTPARPSKARLLLTVAVTAAGLLWLALQVDFAALLGQLRAAAPGAWGLAVAAQCTTTFFMAYRWQRMLAVDGVQLSYGWCLGIYIRSTFLGLFLPSALGGDVYRGVAVARAMGGARATTVNILAERMVGLAAICVLALVGVALAPPLPPQVVISVATGCAAMALGMAALAHPAPAGAMVTVATKLGLRRASAWIERVGRQLRGHLGTTTFFVLLGLSLAQQLVGVLAVHACGLATSIDLGFGFYLVTVPVVWVLSFTPSIAGTGPREAGLFYFLTLAGIAPEPAAACATLLLATIVARGLLGALAFLLWHPPDP